MVLQSGAVKVRTWALVLLGALGLSLHPGHAHAEDAVEEESARVARQELVETARTQVAPQDPTAGGLAALREATAKERTNLEAALRAVGNAGADWMPKNLTRDPLARLDALVGTTRTEDDGQIVQTSTGLIASGAILYRWVTGGLMEDEKPKPPAAPPATEDTDASDDTPSPQAKLPFFYLVDETNGAVIWRELDPTGPTVGDLENSALRDALIRGTLRVQLEADPQGEEALRFPAIAELLPWAYTASAYRHQHLLVWRDELKSPVSDGYLRWRKAQAAARARVMKLEAPTGLVNDAEVAEKAARVDRLRNEIQSLERLRTTLDQALVRTLPLPEREVSPERAEDLRALLPWAGRLSDLRRSEQKWVDLADQLDVEVERLDLVCKDCPEEEREKNLQKYTVMKLLGRVVQQEQRLLYVTVLRAERRRHMLDGVLEAVKGELRVANEVFDTFEKRRDGARLMRQLINLRNARRDLAVDLAEIDRLDPVDPEKPDAKRSVRYRRVAGLIAYNEALEQLVTIRRDLELAADAPSKTTPMQERPAPVAPAPSAEPTPSESPAEGGAGASTPEGAANEREGTAPPGAAAAPPPPEPTPEEDAAALPEDLLTPRGQFIDATYVAHATEFLDRPEFDSGLVARHYEAVDRTIQKLDAALASVAEVDARAANLAALETTSAALLASDGPARLDFQLRSDKLKLERMVTTKDVTLVGIEKAAGRLTTRRAVLAEYRDRLRELKLRSFRIREDRTLTSETLGAVADDVGSTGQRVWRWLTFGGDEHLGTFVAQRILPLLAWLGILLGAFLFVRVTRAAIDRKLTAMAATIDALGDESISVKAEAEQVEEQRRAAEAKRQAAEEGALAEARGESDRTRPVSGAPEEGLE